MQMTLQVPEPQTYLMLGLGLLAIGALRMRGLGRPERLTALRGEAPRSNRAGIELAAVSRRDACASEKFFGHNPAAGLAQ